MTQKPTQLQRSLKARHLTMLAIGGSIGTGLFVASGSSIAQAGPGGALIAYALIGLMVYFLMTGLGELAATIPLPGSFILYGSRFVDQAFGFALGWNYWYNWAITIAVELVAASIVMQYWLPDVPGIVWSAIFLLLTFLINFFSVKGFGEVEYWCSLIKVGTIVIFILVGLLMIMGILRGTAPPVATPWEIFIFGEAPMVGGLPAVVGVAMVAGFSFQGTELVGVAAGESDDPKRTIPLAIKQIFWRVLLFYGLAILIIGLLIPYTDPRLLKNDLSQVSVSPFTLIFQRAGMASAAGVMNAVILSAILSAGNSGMYASSRMLHTLAVRGMAPSFFAKLSAHGSPRRALWATTAVAALCFLSTGFGDQVVYLWLLNASGVCGFIVWLGIAICHYRFRRGYLAQGRRLDELPYRAKLFPLGPLFSVAACLIIILGQDYSSIIKGTFDWRAALAGYIGIPLFLVLWLGYRLRHKSCLVKYREMDFSALEESSDSKEI